MKKHSRQKQSLLRSRWKTHRTTNHGLNDRSKTLCVRRYLKTAGDAADEARRERKKQHKHVYRILNAKDISKKLLEREVFTVWPDNGLWYPAHIEKARFANLV